MDKTSDLKALITNLLKEEFGEYAHFEVKTLAGWDTLEAKSEFIKDVQSLCNSLSVEPVRYLVIGYDKYKKEFTDVSNYNDYDDGKLVSMLSAYFDPEITFRSHVFTTEDGKHFVVLEFPREKLSPPHVIKKEIQEQGKPSLLNFGEIWIKGGGKGGSSAKRRATRADLHEMFDFYIEQLAEKRAQIRVTDILKTKKIGEAAKDLLLPENFDTSLIYKEDDIYMDVVRQLVLGEKSILLRELIESLKHTVISSWKKLKYEGSQPADLTAFTELTKETIDNQIKPVMRKLTLLGMQLIKVRAYPTIFDNILEVISDFYTYGCVSGYGVQSVQNFK